MHEKGEPESGREVSPLLTSPDPVDEASRESFPASDPPSWSPLHAGDPEPDESVESTKDD